MDRFSLHRESSRNTAERATALVQDEFLTALEQDPGRMIPTPEWRCGSTRASEVVFEMMAGDDELWFSMLRLLVEAKRGVEVQTQAQLLLSIMQRRHSDRHAGAVAEELL